MDNRYLQTDMKYTNEDARLLGAKFIYGNVLIGLGLIREYREHEKKAKMEKPESNGIVGSGMSNGEFTVEDYVKQTTKALAPFILPMINNLGALSENDVGGAGQIGDDE